MNLIEIFGTIIKPIICKGKFMFAPINNEKIGENIYALRDKDVNVFIYKKENNIIAIDCGYKNSKNINKSLDYFGIFENDVSHIFITHLDLDHSGGIDIRCKRVFKNAKIYIGNIEKGYCENKLYRKNIGFIGLKSPIKINDYNTLENMQIEYVGNIKIQAILTAGHTLGHLCYLIDDKYLFTGDSIILVKGKGYCFYNQWNINSKLNMESLEKLKILNGIKLIITSHTGYTDNVEEAFSKINMLPNWKEKDFKVNENAEYNPYK